MSTAYSDEQLRSALEALSEPDRFREAERRVANVAPQLQQVLAGALGDGGYFDSAHLESLGRITALEDPEERLAALRTLLAEETRIGMMIGVAVGWELSRQLDVGQSEV